MNLAHGARALAGADQMVVFLRFRKAYSADVLATRGFLTEDELIRVFDCSDSVLFCRGPWEGQRPCVRRSTGATVIRNSNLGADCKSCTGLLLVQVPQAGIGQESSLRLDVGVVDRTSQVGFRRSRKKIYVRSVSIQRRYICLRDRSQIGLAQAVQIEERSDVSLVVRAYKVHIGHVRIDVNAILNDAVSSGQVLDALEVEWWSVLLGLNHLFCVALLPGCLWRLVATACVLLVDFVAADGGYFEVDSAKLDDVSHSDQLALVIREVVLEHLIDRLLFPDDQPHRLLKINIVLFIFVGVLLGLGLFNYAALDSEAACRRYFTKIGLIKLWLVVCPQFAILGLVHESEDDGLLAL